LLWSGATVWRGGGRPAASWAHHEAGERANRRVTVRRITPLIDEQAANSPGRQ
jgi:hypothetical protein